jgi:hypothetical protein
LRPIVSNIDKFEKFFQDTNQSLLLINQVNEEIGLFYFHLVGFLLQKKSIKFTETSKINKFNSVDLFNNETIYYTVSNSAHDISKLLLNNNKTIIFSDYKNYKKFSNIPLSINGYDFSKDISILIKNYFNDDVSSDLLEYLKNEPHMTFSELFKYKVNKNFKTVVSSNNNDISDLIGNNRKTIFKLKKEQKFKEVFSMIKEEIKIKKFSFLTS